MANPRDAEREKTLREAMILLAGALKKLEIILKQTTTVR